MEIFLPAQTLALFHVFAPYFATLSCAYCQSYLWALMVVESRKCTTRLARGVFFHQRDLRSWERCLAEHRWSVAAVTERLGRLVVERLGAQRQVHGAYLRGTDTTLIAKTAKRMLGVHKWKDRSDNADRGAYLVGHHWHLVGLISPWGARWLCWPLVMRLLPGLQGARPWLGGDAVEPMTFWDAAIAAILEVTRCLGEAGGGRVHPQLYQKALKKSHGTPLRVYLKVTQGEYEILCTRAMQLLLFSSLSPCFGGLPGRNQGRARSPSAPPRVFGRLGKASLPVAATIVRVYVTSAQ
jgi:hypothetical protein